LPGWRPLRRAVAISRVGTRTTRCPAPSRSPLEPSGQVPAVLERELHPVEMGGPLQQPEVPGAGGHDGQLAQSAADIIEGDHGVGAFVGIGADHDHGELLRRGGAHRGSRTTRLRARLSRAERTLLSSHARRAVRASGGAAHRREATGHGQDSEERSEPHQTRSAWH
jgi:hypothetical protein